METLYNNHDINYSAWFSEFEEYCILNGIDHTQYNEDSEYFYEWVQDTLAMEWDDLLTNIKYDKNNNTDCAAKSKIITKSPHSNGNNSITDCTAELIENHNLLV